MVPKANADFIIMNWIMDTIYLSLSAQVAAVGTFFMKPPVCTQIYS